MKTSNKIRSKIMKAAWTIYRKYKVQDMKNWSKALIRAWAWARKTLVSNDITGYSIVKETEKAICIAGQLVCHVTDQVVKSNLWIPKSLINNRAIAEWFYNKKVDEAIANHGYYGNSGSTLHFELI